MFRFFSRQVKPELFWTTDVHSHVCPGIDDGAGTVEMAVELVGGMYDMGFRRMITTPHITDEVFPNTAESIGNSFSILTSALDQSGVGMEMDVAAEHRIDDLFYSMLRENSVRLLPGGKHILIENAWSGEPYGLDALIKNLIKEHGLIPVLAHPERYEYYHHNRDRFADLHKKGVKLQINLLSLSGHYGKEFKKTAEQLLSSGLVSFVGSDLHRQSHIVSIRKYLASSDFRKLQIQAAMIENDKAFAL